MTEHKHNIRRELPLPSVNGIELTEEEKAPKMCSKCKQTKQGGSYFRILKDATMALIVMMTARRVF